MSYWTPYMSEKLGYSLSAQASNFLVSQAASVAKSPNFSAVSRYSTHAQTNSDAIHTVFKNLDQIRLTRTKSTHQLPSRSKPIQKTQLPSSPKNVVSQHDSTGPVKSTVATLPIL